MQVTSLRKQSGASLVEMVVSIVVVSIALTGILSTIDYLTRRSVDPVLQSGAMSVGRQTLEYLMHIPYEDVETISPAEFEQLMRDTPGHPFTEYVTRKRIDVNVLVSPLNFNGQLGKHVTVILQNSFLPGGEVRLSCYRFPPPIL